MFWQLASFYFVPAAFIGLGIWMLMSLLRNLGIKYRVRRVLFVFVSVIFLMPVIVPAGTIMTIFVPNGLLLLLGGFPMMHQPGLKTIFYMSIGVTAIVTAPLAVVLIKDVQHGLRSPSKLRYASRISLPIVVIGLLLAFYFNSIPERTIPGHVDRALIEAAYGRQLDEVARTLDIDDLEQVVRERSRLHDMFKADPIVFRVEFRDRRFESADYASRVLFMRDIGAVNGHSCSGDGASYQTDRIMRCTWGRTHLGDLETFVYRRDSWVGEQNNRISIHFDYEAFISKHPSSGT